MQEHFRQVRREGEVKKYVLLAGASRVIDPDPASPDDGPFWYPSRSRRSLCRVPPRAKRSTSTRRTIWILSLANFCLPSRSAQPGGGSTFCLGSES